MGEAKRRRETEALRPPGYTAMEDVESQAIVEGDECVIGFSKPINVLRLKRGDLAAFIAGLQAQLDRLAVDEPRT
jgi:hypothetical protein